MTNQEASNRLKQWMRNGCDGMTDERLGYIEGWFHKSDKEAFELAISALEQESILDKLDVIITDALDISIDQKESQTLRWVLDMIGEVSI